MSIPKHTTEARIYKYRVGSGQKGGARDLVAQGDPRETNSVARVRAGEFGQGSYRIEYRSATNQWLGIENVKFPKGFKLPRVRRPSVKKATRAPVAPAAPDTLLFAPTGEPAAPAVRIAAQATDDALAQWTQATSDLGTRTTKIRAVLAILKDTLPRVQMALEREVLAALLDSDADVAEGTSALQALGQAVTDLEALRVSPALQLARRSARRR
jgi:hypothetical protein